MEDQHIIKHCLDGDTSYFEVLVNRYQDRIYTLCRYMLENQDDAEDAAQDTFIKAFQGIRGFTPTASFYTWLYRIAVNTCLDHKRKFSFRSLFFSSDKETHIDSFPSQDPSPESAYDTKQSMQALLSILKHLSEKYRVVIILNELEGLSYEEIAEILDVSIGTVKSRIFRAREELNKNMKKLRNKNEDGSFNKKESNDEMFKSR